jgi:dolichol kinase
VLICFWYEICYNFYMSDLRLSAFPGFRDVKTEIVRKGLHFLIAMVPGIASLSLRVAEGILISGVLLYSCLEILRLSGVRVPLVSAMTEIASRSRDEGRFVLGPVTLALGALLVLVVYPLPAASVAIYALAFGDGFASLAGRFFGRLRPVFLYGKSLEGSLACFAAAFAAALWISGNPWISLIAAATATVVEALPLRDYDNLAIPVAVGFAVQAFL